MQWLWRIPAIGIISYLAFCAMIYFMQAEIIFHPDISGRKLLTSPKNIGLDYQNVSLTTEDGINIHGWYIPASNLHNGEKTLLFFHGNAGNISHRLDSIRIFNQMGLNVFIIDYRGYGQSSNGNSGVITETGTYLDAKAAWLYLTNKRMTNSEDIIIFGRSLGASIAAWLATQFSPAALIIESGFSSVISMGRRFYPYLPVSLLSRYQYNTKKHIAKVKSPVLIAHSKNDEIIPYDESLTIFEAAPEPKQFLSMRGGHNDGFITSGQKYIDGIKLFIFQ